MTRDEFEAILAAATWMRHMGRKNFLLRVDEVEELCRLALIGEQAERLENAIQASMMAGAPVRKDDDAGRD